MNKLLIFFVFIVFSQTPSKHIVVEYDISTSELTANIPDVDKVPKSVIESFKKSFELINQMTTSLVATKSEGYCWTTNEVPNDVSTSEYETAIIMLGGNDKYYLNLNKDIVNKYFNAYGEKVYTEKKIKDFNWVLSKDSKMIGDYKCFKATLTYEVENLSGVHKKKVTAYYTPEINYSYGPMGYGGLPGLIIELKDDKITYVVNNVKFKDEDLKFPKLPKSKLVTEKELKEMYKVAKANRGW